MHYANTRQTPASTHMPLCGGILEQDRRICNVSQQARRLAVGLRRGLGTGPYRRPQHGIHWVSMRLGTDKPLRGCLEMTWCVCALCVRWTRKRGFNWACTRHQQKPACCKGCGRCRCPRTTLPWWRQSSETITWYVAWHVVGEQATTEN